MPSCHLLRVQLLLPRVNLLLLGQRSLICKVKLLSELGKSLMSLLVRLSLTLLVKSCEQNWMRPNRRFNRFIHSSMSCVSHPRATPQLQDLTLAKDNAVAALKSELDTQRRTAADLQVLATTLRADNDTATTRIKTLEDALAETERNRSLLSTQHDAVTGELSSLKDVLLKRTSELAAAKAEANREEQELSRSSATLGHLESRVAELESSFAEARAALGQANITADALRFQKASTDQSVSHLSAQITDLQRALTEAYDQKAVLERDHGTSVAHLAEARDEITRLDAALRDKSLAEKQVSQSLADARAECQRLAQQIKALEAQLAEKDQMVQHTKEELGTRVSDLQKQLAVVQQRCAASDAKCRDVSFFLAVCVALHLTIIMNTVDWGVGKENQRESSVSRSCECSRGYYCSA